MEVVLGVVIGILTLLGIVFSRWITTFIHELGHGLSALILSKGPVDMYIGNHIKNQKNLQIKLGKLNFNFSFVIWKWDIGTTAYKETTRRWKNIVIILSGPLISIVLGSFLLRLILFYNLSDGMKFILAVFMLSAFWDFLINIIPRHQPVHLPDGSFVYNDGRQLLDLFSMQTMPKLYMEALDDIDAQKYPEALKKLNSLEDEEKKERYYYEAKLDIHHLTKDSNAYIEEFEAYILSMDPGLKYVSNWAKAKIRTHAYDEVIEKLTNIIYDGKGNYDLYFLRGKALVELSEYSDAMRDFHALTLGEIEDPLALANRAYCQFRLGYTEEAQEDVLEAIEHAKFEQGEIYFLAGVIFEETDEEKALTYYKKAESLKYDHHALTFNISRIEKFK